MRRRLQATGNRLQVRGNRTRKRFSIARSAFRLRVLLPVACRLKPRVSGPVAFRMARPTHRQLRQLPTPAGYLPGRKLYVSAPGPGKTPSPIPQVVHPPDPHELHELHELHEPHGSHGLQHRSRRHQDEPDSQPQLVQPVAPAVANARTTRSRSFFIVGISSTKRKPWPASLGQATLPHDE